MLYVMRWSNLRKMQQEFSDSEEEDSDSDMDENGEFDEAEAEPVLEHRWV